MTINLKSITISTDNTTTKETSLRIDALKSEVSPKDARQCSKRPQIEAFKPDVSESGAPKTMEDKIKRRQEEIAEYAAAREDEINATAQQLVPI